MHTKPAKKQKAMLKTQATVTDYFGKAETSKLTQKMKPASPKGKGKGKGKAVKSEDEDESDFEDLPKPPASRRAGRGVRKNYVEIMSSSEVEA